MKKFFLSALLLFAFVVESTAQWGTMKSLLESIPVTAPPTSDMSKQLKKWVVLNEENRKFPDVIYRDFLRTQAEVYSDPDREEYCAAYCQIRKPGNDNYTVLGVSLGEADVTSTLLVTYDLNGTQLDWVEVDAKFSDIKLKQYKITPEMKLFVYELKPTSPTPIYYYEDYIQKKVASLNARRIDTVYQIDDNGKVNKLSEKKYQPKDYSMTTLETADIWNGNETPLQ